MVENDIVILEDFWKDRQVNPTNSMFKNINKLEFLEEEELNFIKKYHSKIEIEDNLCTEHLLYFKTDRLIDWYLIRKDFLVKIKEVLQLKQKMLELQKDIDMLNIAKEKAFQEI